MAEQGGVGECFVFVVVVGGGVSFYQVNVPGMFCVINLCTSCLQ